MVRRLRRRCRVFAEGRTCTRDIPDPDLALAIVVFFDDRVLDLEHLSIA